jgi:RNA polymerase sigma factor (sigma-70 family)
MAAMRVEEVGSEASVRSAMTNVERSVRRFSRNDSQDIVQDAMVRAVKGGVACDAEPWLRTVARRIAIDKSRRAHEVATGGPEDIDAISRVRGHTPEDVVLSNEGLNLVGKAMESMPARYRDALLTFAEEQKPDSVAKRFGISSAATWTLLSRARSRLRQELDRVGYAFGGIAVPIHRWATEASTAVAAVSVALGTTVGAAHVVAAKPAVPVQPPSIAEASPATAAQQPIVKVVAVNPPAVPAVPLPLNVTTPPVDTDPAPLATKVCTTVTEAPITSTLTDAPRKLLGAVTSKLPEPVQKLTCTKP